MIDFSNKKALLIEDLPEARAMQKKMLVDFGFSSVDVAMKAESALELLHSSTYDVILSDYNLGKGKNGQQILEEVRLASLIPNTSTYLMVTAETSMEMVMGSIECQPDGYIAKPFSQALLQKRLVKLIESKEKLKAINIALDEGDFQLAIDECIRVSKQHPILHGRCQRILSDCYISLKQYDKALELFDHVLEERQMPWALFGKAKVQFLQKKFLKSEANFKQLTFDNQFFVNSHDWLAKCLMAQNKYQEAQQVLIEALKKSPQSVVRQKTLGNISLKLKDYEVAETSFRKAVSLAKHSHFNTPDIYINHLVSIIKIGQISETLHLKQKNIFKRTAQKIDLYFENNLKTMTHKYELSVDLYIAVKDKVQAMSALNIWDKQASIGKANPPPVDLEAKIAALEEKSIESNVEKK
ncbi:response regulator [Marinomonas sp. 2405UD68-3]|uniref:response regulator n=1 Tax=Marinomonas sp. 2405UD68-3 TaxID=3391835 RepID=UPI0039C93629